MSPPNRNSQYDSMFRRGKATSGAPICRGMIALANPANVGVAKNSSITVPCSVNAWLYCSVDRICSPGRASSARTNSASTPPIRKKAKDEIRYRCPIFLWSVVVSQETATRPLLGPSICTGVTGSVTDAITVHFSRS